MSFYLIDFENVGETGFNGIENLQKEDTVIVFYSKNSCKISMDILSRNNTVMQFIKADVGTKNALDFQLVSYLGFMARTSADKEQFFIISKDNGYSPLVTFWKRYGVDVKLASALSGKVVPAPEKKKKSKTVEKTSDSENQQNDSTIDKLKVDIEKAVSDILKKRNKIDGVIKIVLDSRTKDELNSALNKFLKDGEKVHKIIKSVKPFVELKA
ncbi:MAG: hypothetical protein K2K02_09540 [Ruminococcus sp.]|nr:hypothetical protein [Ruminococcus sp.]